MSRKGKVLVAVGGWGPCYQRLSTVACLRLDPPSPPAAPPPRRETESSPPQQQLPNFAAGDVVILHGLVGGAQHNGKRGVVRGYDQGSGRFKVSVAGRPKPLGVKAANLLPPTRGWEMLPPMRAKRIGPAVAATASGAIFVAGGAGDGSAELFELVPPHGEDGEVAAAEQGGWRTLAPMPQGERSSGCACLLADGRVLVMGGLGKRGRSIMATVEAWAPPVGSGGGTRAQRGSAAGGQEGGHRRLGAARVDHRDDPAGESRSEGGTWVSLCSMRTARVNFGACTLPGGSRVRVVGGEVASPPARGGNGGGVTAGGGGITQDAEVYDAASDSWAALPQMSVERHGCGCAALADGTVLIAGGYGGLDRRTSAAAAAAAVAGGRQQPQPPQTELLSAVPTGATDRPARRPAAAGCPCCVVFTSEAGKHGDGRHLHSAELASDNGAGRWSKPRRRRRLDLCVRPVLTEIYLCHACSVSID
jgi:hypothetical protein